MTLTQMRLMYGLITDALTALAQGGEAMDRLTEVYTARGGNGAVAALLAANPEAADEINEFAALVADVTPIVTMLKAGLMKPASAERAVLMERRGDA
jgi:hypothetical protein